jgi:hypothetical protein
MTGCELTSGGNHVNHDCCSSKASLELVAGGNSLENAAHSNFISCSMLWLYAPDVACAQPSMLSAGSEEPSQDKLRVCGPRHPITDVPPMLAHFRGLHFWKVPFLYSCAYFLVFCAELPVCSNLQPISL